MVCIVCVYSQALIHWGTRMKSSEVINKLEQDGWTLARVRGDHWYYTKPGFRRPTCVTHPRKDIPKGLLVAIERQTGVKLR